MWGKDNQIHMIVVNQLSVQLACCKTSAAVAVVIASAGSQQL